MDARWSMMAGVSTLRVQVLKREKEAGVKASMISLSQTRILIGRLGWLV